jgi:hypothetical protein
MNYQGHLGFTNREKLLSFDLTGLPKGMQDSIAGYFSYFDVAQGDTEHLTYRLNRFFGAGDRQNCYVGIPLQDGTERLFCVVRDTAHSVVVKLGPMDALAFH